MRFRVAVLACAAVFAACAPGQPSSSTSVPPASQDAAAPVAYGRTSHGVPSALLGERVPVPVTALAEPAAEAATPAVPAAAMVGDSGSPTVSITVRGFAFPEEVHVTPGTRLVWVNADSDDHDVTAVDITWGSPVLAVGASYGRDFTEPGRYAYLCTLHPFMRGVVIVE